jgi:hypothetical protein
MPSSRSAPSIFVPGCLTTDEAMGPTGPGLRRSSGGGRVHSQGRAHMTHHGLFCPPSRGPLAPWPQRSARLVMVAALCGAAGTMSCGAETDSPAEPPFQSLFSIAVIADPHITTNADHEERLAAAIAWINENALSQEIELVVVLGDIGWGAGLTQAKQLLDELDVLYVPVIGDNEIAAGDDQAFDTTYQPHYQRLDEGLDDFRRSSVPVSDPQGEMNAWLQNLAFDYRGLHFFALDLCIRGDDTIMGEFGDLHDFEGGSWPWLQAQWSALEPSRRESIILLSHIPMFLGALDTEEMPKVNALLEPVGDYVYANLAGHLHGNLVREGAGFDVYVTDATHDDDNTIRVIEVRGNEQGFAFAHSLVVIP